MEKFLKRVKAGLKETQGINDDIYYLLIDELISIYYIFSKANKLFIYLLKYKIKKYKLSNFILDS